MKSQFQFVDERQTGAKTVPRNQATKKMGCNTNDFMRFRGFERMKNIRKTRYKYREGGRTVGSGRVATIIE